MTSSVALAPSTFLRRLVRAPFKLLPRDTVAPILHGPLRGQKWIISSHRYVCWVGSYESYIQSLLAKQVLQGGVFYDVGANVGFYSLLAASVLKAKSIFSFEPLPANVFYLRRHLDLNRVRNAHVHEVAVSDHVGNSFFREELTRSMGSLQESGTLLVSTTTLDALLQQQCIAPPDCIKMDIEGAEFGALNGAKQCFSRYKPQLMLATHGKQVHEGCCRLLQSWNYTLQLIDEPSEDRGEIWATPAPTP